MPLLLRLAPLLAALAGMPALAAPAPDAGAARVQAPQARLTESAVGIVSRHVLPRADGRRAWRIDVAVPPGRPPATGWPVIYLLDGNAVFQALSRTDDAGAAPRAVLVGIGYDTDQRIEGEARAWDYTPLPRGAGADGAPDPRAPTRRNGGADAFLDAIVERIKPLVADVAPIDPARETLFGHSYGGLFALHVLLARPAAFERYVIASPSLWWHAPFMQERVAGWAKREAPAPRALFVVGGREGERRGTAPAGASFPPSSSAAVEGVRALAARMAARPGAQVRLEVFEELGHGPMLPASIDPAIRFALEP